VRTEGSRPVPPPPVKDDGFDDPRCLPPSRCRLVARSGSRGASFDDAPVVHHSLAARSAFRHSNGKRQRNLDSATFTTETRGHDHRAPRSSPAPVLSPGSRFDGLRRPESHVDLRRRPERASRHATTLGRVVAFRDRADSRFRYEPAPHRPRCDAPGTSPEGAAFDVRAHHFFATRRLATTRRAIMASDVSRGLRAAADWQREGPVRATPRGSGTQQDPLLAEAPNTLCHRPGCVNGWSAAHDLAKNPLGRPRSSFTSPPAKEETFPKTRVLGAAP